MRAPTEEKRHKLGVARVILVITETARVAPTLPPVDGKGRHVPNKKAVRPPSIQQQIKFPRGREVQLRLDKTLKSVLGLRQELLLGTAQYSRVGEIVQQIIICSHHLKNQDPMRPRLYKLAVGLREAIQCVGSGSRFMKFKEGYFLDPADYTIYNINQSKNIRPRNNSGARHSETVIYQGQRAAPPLNARHAPLNVVPQQGQAALIVPQHQVSIISRTPLRARSWTSAPPSSGPPEEASRVSLPTTSQAGGATSAPPSPGPSTEASRVSLPTTSQAGGATSAPPSPGPSAKATLTEASRSTTTPQAGDARTVALVAGPSGITVIRSKSDAIPAKQHEISPQYNATNPGYDPWVFAEDPPIAWIPQGVEDQTKVVHSDETVHDNSGDDNHGDSRRSSLQNSETIPGSIQSRDQCASAVGIYLNARISQGVEDLTEVVHSDERVSSNSGNDDLGESRRSSLQDSAKNPIQHIAQVSDRGRLEAWVVNRSGQEADNGVTYGGSVGDGSDSDQDEASGRYSKLASSVTLNPAESTPDGSRRCSNASVIFNIPTPQQSEVRIAVKEMVDSWMNQSAGASQNTDGFVLTEAASSVRTEAKKLLGDSADVQVVTDLFWLIMADLEDKADFEAEQKRVKYGLRLVEKFAEVYKSELSQSAWEMLVANRAYLQRLLKSMEKAFDPLSFSMSDVVKKIAAAKADDAQDSIVNEHMAMVQSYVILLDHLNTHGRSVPVEVLSRLRTFMTMRLADLDLGRLSNLTVNQEVRSLWKVFCSQVLNTQLAEHLRAARPADSNINLDAETLVVKSRENLELVAREILRTAVNYKVKPLSMLFQVIFGSVDGVVDLCSIATRLQTFYCALEYLSEFVGKDCGTGIDPRTIFQFEAEVNPNVESVQKGIAKSRSSEHDGSVLLLGLRKIMQNYQPAPVLLFYTEHAKIKEILPDFESSFESCPVGLGQLQAAYKQLEKEFALPTTPRSAETNAAPSLTPAEQH